MAAAQRCLGRRLPAGDVSWLRMVARRSGGLADELRRVSDVLSGSAGATGWWGSGQRGFAASVGAVLPELGRVASRYEQYGQALVGYAVVLDRLQPRLFSLRRQLADQCSQATSVATAPGDLHRGVDAGCDARLRSLVADFDAAWTEWNTALGRCLHGLSRAGSIDADRGSWSAFGHGLVHVLSAVSDPVVGFVEHPSLAALSGALGSLGDDLTVAGLVLLAVCPPAAGVVFSAAAIVSAAKLATDAVRAGRGDPHVGAGALGMDALGALGGGRLLKAGEEGAKGVRTLEDLAEHERSTRLVPGGGLGTHESALNGPARGHTLQRHVGRSEKDLFARLKDEPNRQLASSFYDRQTAENSISDLLAASQTKIDAWLTGGSPKLTLYGSSDRPIGITVARVDSSISHVSALVTCLRKDPTMSIGYRIQTSFPRP